MSRRQGLLAAILTVLAVTAAGCGAVRIETGATPEEETARSESQASALRRTWAQTFDQADRLRRADLLKTHLDSTSARLILVGRQFAGEWRDGNRGRGQVIPAEEFRRVIDNSIAKDRPILQAWEDNLEYGWEWVRDSSRFDSGRIGLFEEFVRHYYDVYSAVFLPQADAETYVAEIDRMEAATRKLSEELARELSRQP
ncbi:MAG TPA: hypothetical protein PKY95_05645 [candidate division Zixibacteria bacterium]|mgnify:CR=1 FL=1|nr:hypothetical protein [candidate division Zixibacteria bacterium]